MDGGCDDRAEGGASLGRGMKLGGAKKDSLSVEKGTSDHVQGLMAEDHLVAPVRKTGPSVANGANGASEASEGAVHVAVEEELSVKLSRDGLIESVDVKGTLAVRVHDAAAAKVRIQLGELSAEGFQCQLHPTIARSFFADRILQLKQPDRGFPVDSSVSLLRWRQPAGGDALLPLNVTCWPESVDAGCTVNVEYTLNPAVLARIENLRICIPLPSGASPEVLAIDGNYHYVGESGADEA